MWGGGGGEFVCVFGVFEKSGRSRERAENLVIEQRV